MPNWIEAQCRAKGLRLTGQRKVIAQVLAESHDHPDATEPHRALSRLRLRDCWRLTHPNTTEDQGTFHEFTGTRSRERIDWIFVSEHLEVARCAIDCRSRNGRYPSDHFPLVADLR